MLKARKNDDDFRVDRIRPPYLSEFEQSAFSIQQRCAAESREYGMAVLVAEMRSNAAGEWKY